MDLSYSIEQELQGHKERLLGDVRKVTFKSEPDEISKSVTEARRLWKEADKYRTEGQYDKSFFALHLYIRIALEHSLHKLSTLPKIQRLPASDQKLFATLSSEVVKNLMEVEDILGVVYDGIRQQVTIKHRQIARENARKAPLNKPKESPKPQAPGENIRRAGIATASAVPLVGMADTGPPPMPLNSNGPSATGAGQIDVSYPSLDEPKPSVPKPSNASPAPMMGHRLKNSVSTGEEVASTRLRVQQVTGDGSCAFRAIAQGLNNGKLSAGDEKRIADSLRASVVDQLRRKRNTEANDIGLSVEQVITMDTNSKHSGFDSYLQGMSRSDYAGEIELWLLSEMLSRKISVFKQDGGSLRNITTYGNAPGKDIKLLWQKGRTEAGNHYNVLLPA